MGTVSWVQVGRDLTWNEALVIATAAGGVLYKEQSSPDDRFLARLAEAGPRDDAYEYPVWTGAHRTSTGFQWLDGTPVDLGKFQPGSVNGDSDLANDSGFVVLKDRYLADAAGESVQSLLMESFARVSNGTIYSDWYVLGGAGPGQTVRMMGGNDIYADYNDSGFGPFLGGGTVDAGSGDDYIYVQGDGFTTAFDGEGRDNVTLVNGVIKAAADGDNDEFFVDSGRVSYAAAKEDLVAVSGVVSSTEVGRDLVATPEIVGGAGDDEISGFARIRAAGATTHSRRNRAPRAGTATIR